MKIEQMKELFELSKMIDNDEGKESGNFSERSNYDIWQIGEKYLIRTVTMYAVGKLEYVGAKELVLSNAAWIADTGRFNEALKNGIENVEKSEIEPFKKDIIIGRGAIVDATIYEHSLELKRK